MFSVNMDSTLVVWVEPVLWVVEDLILDRYTSDMRDVEFVYPTAYAHQV